MRHMALSRSFVPPVAVGIQPGMRRRKLEGRRPLREHGQKQFAPGPEHAPQFAQRGLKARRIRVIDDIIGHNAVKAAIFKGQAQHIGLLNPDFKPLPAGPLLQVGHRFLRYVHPVYVETLPSHVDRVPPQPAAHIQKIPKRQTGPPFGEKGCFVGRHQPLFALVLAPIPSLCNAHARFRLLSPYHIISAYLM